MDTIKRTIWTIVLVVCLVVAAWSYWPADYQANTASGVSQASLTQADTAPEPVLVPIKDIRVGMRVPAHNPELSDAERKRIVDPNPLTWRHITLEMVKSDGGVLDIEMIRPLSWIQEHNAWPEETIQLEMEELGAVGPAKVIEMSDCPEIPGGPGEVVISTFAHPPSSQVMNLTIEGDEGQTETIGVTETHPFWSVEHDAFLPVGKLEAGDRIRTLNGQTKRIVSVLPRPGPAERVYNFEVNGEHVYYVGEQQLLVHNNCEIDRIARKHGGVPIEDDPNPLAYFFKNRKSALNAASEIAGDLGHSPVPVRLSSYRDPKLTYFANNSNRVIGKHSMTVDSYGRPVAGYHIHNVGHTAFGETRSHINAWGRFGTTIKTNVHFFYSLD